jgi:hypothetical protein
VVAVRPEYTPIAYIPAPNPVAASNEYPASATSSKTATVPSINGSGSGNVEVQPKDEDVASDYDPLFDEPDASGDIDMNLVSDLPTDPFSSTLPSQASLSMPGSEPPAGTNAWQPAAAPAPSWRSALPPKNMPPMLDTSAYATYSVDLLMTASIDGQVILWDRRVNSTGRGVGRLWLSDKTPPWCMSVRTQAFHLKTRLRSYASTAVCARHCRTNMVRYRRVGQRMERRSTRVAGTARWTCGTYGSWASLGLR